MLLSCRAAAWCKGQEGRTLHRTLPIENGGPSVRAGKGFMEIIQELSHCNDKTQRLERALDSPSAVSPQVLTSYSGLPQGAAWAHTSLRTENSLPPGEACSLSVNLWLFYILCNCHLCLCHMEKAFHLGKGLKSWLCPMALHCIIVSRKEQLGTQTLCCPGCLSFSQS